MTMSDPNNRPSFLGAFKPVNHVVLAFPTAADQGAAESEMASALKLDAGKIHRMTPQQVIDGVDYDLQHAGGLADVGQELNLLRAHRELAVRGHSFLVVPGTGDTARQIADIARRHNAARAQAYGRFIIEELIEVGDGLTQVAESPERGLDAQTVSGNEKAA